jgi:hypothetical protein
MGFPERMDLVEAPTEHTYSLEHCVAGARWFGRWFLGRELAVPVEDVPTLPEPELNCTPEGQVLRLPGARSLFALNLAEEEALGSIRARLWREPAAALREVRRVTGIRRLEDIPELGREEIGRIERRDATVVKLILSPEPGISLPALHFQPTTGATNGVVLYVHGEGSALAAAPGGAIERLVASGRSVLAVDLRACGETAPRGGRPTRYSEIVGYATKEWSLAYLLGTSFVRMRAEDLLTCARYLASQSPAGGGSVGLVATGAAAVPALHAVALEAGLFSEVRLDAELVSWATTLKNPLTPRQQDSAVFGALHVYDLSDLLAAIPAGRLALTPTLK